ncbi:hypothetical protein PG993_009381 [Apiospora rasikravindrae]|uniref:Uncharacterized protein n=1 Tax=Apiospora rasikravindrae TaxID=990691 RepID=A0ABR1SKI1_9PEZI
MENPRDTYEKEPNAALHFSQRLLTTPIPGTNCRLEEVARITTRRAKEALQQLGGGDDVPFSAGFATAWKEFTDAESALGHWHNLSQTYVKAIRDLKVMYTHYLSLKYEYHRYETFQIHQEMYKAQLGLPPSPGPSSIQTIGDAIGALAGNLDSHLLLDRDLWQRAFFALKEEHDQLRQWEQRGPPKSKAPPTSHLTWLIKILELFLETDTSKAMNALRVAVTNVPDLFDETRIRHVKCVNEGQERLALLEVDRDLDSLAVWAPNEYNTEVLERAIVSYRAKVVDYISTVGRVRNGVQLR